jgi:hypothetical protein
MKRMMSEMKKKQMKMKRMMSEMKKKQIKMKRKMYEMKRNKGTCQICISVQVNMKREPAKGQESLQEVL